jgi:hypothetical protein
MDTPNSKKKNERTKFIELLTSETICAFEKSKGDREGLKAVLIQSLIRGYEAGIEPKKLWGIISQGHGCIIEQAKLPTDDKKILHSHMTSLMSEVYYDCPAKSSADAIERHKERIRKWYDNWTTRP